MNLVEARKLSGLSLQQVADRYNVSKSSVYLWERTEKEKGVSQPIANLIAMDLVRQSFPTKIDWYTRCCLLFAEDTADREALLQRRTTEQAGKYLAIHRQRFHRRRTSRP